MEISYFPNTLHTTPLHKIGNPPTRHRGLPGPSGPEPQKSPKRVRKGVLPRGAPESPKSAPRSPKRVQKRSPKLRFWTLFGLRGALFADMGLPGAGHPFGLVSDSFGVPGPKGSGDLCAWSGGSQHKQFHGWVGACVRALEQD